MRTFPLRYPAAGPPHCFSTHTRVSGRRIGGIAAIPDGGMSQMRVIVTGSRGLLGTAFRRVAEQSPQITDLVLPDRRDLDVTQELDVERYISTVRPDIVINSAVLMPADLCESHPETAYRI